MTTRKIIIVLLIAGLAGLGGIWGTMPMPGPTACINMGNKIHALGFIVIAVEIATLVSLWSEK